MDDRKQAIIQTFRETLNSLAGDRVENDMLLESMIYNATYLIPWQIEPDFSAHVKALDHQFDSRLKIRYNNFTAPFNFAQLDRLE